MHAVKLKILVFDDVASADACAGGTLDSVVVILAWLDSVVRGVLVAVEVWREFASAMARKCVVWSFGSFTRWSGSSIGGSLEKSNSESAR